jgi:hypothetical protein
MHHIGDLFELNVKLRGQKVNSPDDGHMAARNM